MTYFLQCHIHQSLSLQTFVDYYNNIKQKTQLENGKQYFQKRLVDLNNIILQMVSACCLDKFKWVEVSKHLLLKTGRTRSGKQCRERWQHQLNPSIVREQWTLAEQATLFQMQIKFGNKWAQIAEFLPGRTDNAVKNFFYSSVRRVLTKINMYMVKQRIRKQFKTIRQFQSDYLSKLMAVVDGHYDKRVRLAGPQTPILAKLIVSEITKLISLEHLDNVEGSSQYLDQLIIKMHDFRKSCKKRKQTKQFEDNQRQVQSQSFNQQSSSPKNSASSISSEKKRRNSAQCQKQISIHNIIDEPMEIQQQKIGSTMLLISKKSQQSISDYLQYSSTNNVQLKRIDTYYEQPGLFKSFSGFQYEQKQRNLDIFNEDNFLKVGFNKMEEQGFEWGRGEEVEFFSLSFGQREDLLGSCHYFDTNQVVTKLKMLEASMTLDQCLLKARQSSYYEYTKNPESGL